MESTVRHQVQRWNLLVGCSIYFFGSEILRAGEKSSRKNGIDHGFGQAKITFGQGGTGRLVVSWRSGASKFFANKMRNSLRAPIIWRVFFYKKERPPIYKSQTTFNNLSFD